MDDNVNAAQPESATGSECVEDKNTTQDAPAVSSPAPGALADQSPTAADQDFAEFQQTVKEIVGEETAVQAEEKPPVADPAKTDDEPAGQPKGDKSPEALSQETQDAAKWTKRPEWKQLTELADKVSPDAGKAVRATLRTLFKGQDDLTGALNRAKPAQDVVLEMMQSVGNSQQGFNNMRHLIRSFNDDPAGAVPMLEKLLTDARSRSGMVIQSPEFVAELKTLEEQARDGQITPEVLDRRKKEMLELEQGRASTKRQTERTRTQATVAERTKAAQKQQVEVDAVNAAEAEWAAEKQKSDPDFGAVQTLHKMFVDQNSIEFFHQHKRIPTGPEAREILEKSLKEAKAEAGKFRPKGKPRPVLTDNGNGSSRDTRQQPQTELDEFRADVQKAHKSRHG